MCRVFFDSLGEALLKKGMLKEALAEYNKVVELNPNSKNAKDKVQEIKTLLNKKS